MRYIMFLFLSLLALEASNLDLGKKYFEQKEYKKAHDVFFQVAQSGMVAKYNLAIMYESGLGVKKDSKKALEFYILSANDGFSKSQLVLADAYLTGVGVSQNIDKAEYWYNLAANNGSEIAKDALVKLVKLKKRKTLAKLEKAKENKAYLTIRSNVYSDKVYLNGKYVGTTKLQLAVPSGIPINIEVKKSGYKSFVLTQTFKEKEKKVILAKLIYKK